MNNTERKETGGPSSSSPMEKLQTELKQRLASFLSTRDLLNLAETSKSISSDLGLFIASSPLTDRDSQTEEFYQSKIAECFAVVIPNQEFAAHSMVFTCNVEQVGDVKTKLSIVEQDLPESVQDQEYVIRPQKKRKIALGGKSKEVAQSLERSTPEEYKVSLSFLVKPNKCYRLCVSTPNFVRYEMVRLSEMILHRVGFSKNSTDYRAKQFQVWDHTYRDSEGGVIPDAGPALVYTIHRLVRDKVMK